MTTGLRNLFHQTNSFVLTIPVSLLVFLLRLFVLLAFGVFTFFPLLVRLFLILGRLIGYFALILAAAKAPLRHADPGDVIPRKKFPQ